MAQDSKSKDVYIRTLEERLAHVTLQLGDMARMMRLLQADDRDAVDRPASANSSPLPERHGLPASFNIESALRSASSSGINCSNSSSDSGGVRASGSPVDGFSADRAIRPMSTSFSVPASFGLENSF